MTTADAAATGGEDYATRTGTLSFQPDETSQTVSVPVSGDLVGEGDEVFLLRLSQPVNATLADGEGAATIRDDDEVEIRIDDLVQLEGAEGSRDAVFTVRLSRLSAREVTVAYATADVDATAGDDYLAASGVLTFPPGETVTSLSVPILGDVEQESHESFLVHLSGALNATLADPEAAGTIFDDDATGWEPSSATTRSSCSTACASPRAIFSGDASTWW